MNSEDIQRYLDVSVAHSVTMDISPVSEAPGYLRTITIHQDNSVTIDFILARVYFDDEAEGGELKYVATYEDLNDIISDLEHYLGKPCDEWVNFTDAPYCAAVPENVDTAQSRTALEGMVRQGSVMLPRGTEYRIASAEWRHIAKYGRFREDKIWEEQEEHLGLKRDS